MIGSVHGCVSCPVVVGPWERRESLSHPQHPLPSHPQPQSQTYSFSQRSSSVHPLPQKTAPDDEKDGDTPSSQGGVHAQTPGQRQHLTETKTEPSNPRSPKKTGSANASPKNTGSANGSPKKAGSANGSPKKTGSANGSPQKTKPTAKSPKSILSIFRSRQATSDQCEQLLGPKNIDDIDVSTSSHKAVVGFQSSSPDDSTGIEQDQGMHYVEPQVGTSRTNFTLPGAVDNGRQHPTNAGNKFSRSSDVKEDFPKESAPESSPPAPEQRLDSSGIGNAPVHKTLSPAPLPSIQDRSKMLTAGALSRELSQVSLVGSLRSSKILPSLSNPKLEPLKATSLPPRPSLSTRKDRKRQTQVPQKKKPGFSDASSDDSHQKIKHGGKGEPDPQSSMSASFNKVTEVSPPKVLASRKPDVAEQQCGSSSELKLEKKAETSSHSQALAQAAPSPVRSSRDAPTPQSLESSVWSFGQSAVASEIDALTTAAAAGDLKTVNSLLAAGVGVNAVNTFGRTAVQVMSLTNTDVAEVLLKAGADPNVQDKGRRAATSTFRTIAHDVADSGNTDMLRCLLRHGADVSLQDKWGNTPLHLAAKGGHLAAVRLLRRGTSLYLPNLQDKTPMMLLEETDESAVKQWVQMKKSSVSRLQTLCVLALRQKLGPDGLRQWGMNASHTKLQLQVLLQTKSIRAPLQTSASTILSSQQSTGSRLPTGRVRGHPLLPGMSTSKQMTDFLTLRDLIPRRLSTGENTSLEVHHNTSGGQSIDDVSLGAGPGAQTTSSLASESGSLFETNLSSIEASHSTDDVSLPSFDQSL